jgi:hypothetical protein
MKFENILILALYINNVKVKCTISKLKNQQFKEVQYRNSALIRKWYLINFGDIAHINDAVKIPGVQIL